MNCISEVKDCPSCKEKLRVNIEWDEKCEVDHSDKKHIPDINISRIELFHKKGD